MPPHSQKIGAVPKILVRHATEAPPRELTRGVQYDLISIALLLTKTSNIQRQVVAFASMGFLDKTPSEWSCPSNADMLSNRSRVISVLGSISGNTEVSAAPKILWACRVMRPHESMEP